MPGRWREALPQRSMLIRTTPHWQRPFFRSSSPGSADSFGEDFLPVSFPVSQPIMEGPGPPRPIPGIPRSGSMDTAGSSGRFAGKASRTIDSRSRDAGRPPGSSGPPCGPGKGRKAPPSAGQARRQWAETSRPRWDPCPSSMEGRTRKELG